MGNLVFQAALGGQVAVSGPNTASSYTIAVPTVNGTFVTTGDTATVTSTMISGPLSVAVGGTGVTTSTGSGSNVLSTSPTLVTPVLGTPTSVTLTNATGLPLTTGVTGTLPVANGGTNLTSFTANGVVYASSTSALATGSALNFDGTNLNIGGTTAGNAGSVSVSIGSPNTTAGGLQLWTNTTASSYLQWGTTASGANYYRGFLQYNYNSGSDYLAFGISTAEKMRLTSAGYLGIGTSSPTAPLQVNVNNSTTNISGSQGGVILQNTNSTSGALNAQFFANSGGYYSAAIYTTQTQTGNAGDNLILNTKTSGGSWNSGLILDTSGNLLVGTTSLVNSEKFNVTQTTNQSIAYLKNSVASNTQVNLQIAITDASTSGSKYYAIATYAGATPAYRFIVADSGSVTNSTGSYGTISDIKLKENIVDTTPKLADVMKLQVRNFNLKSDPHNKQIGFIAQEMETVFPSMVESHFDRDADGNTTDEITKTVKTSVLVPILVKAIQELNTLVTAQFAEIQSLKAEVAALKGA